MISLKILVQPRSSRTEVVGMHGDRLKIKLKSPPVDGAANAELVRFLSELLGVGRRSISIDAGASGRQKTVRIEGEARLPEAWRGAVVAPRA